MTQDTDRSAMIAQALEDAALLGIPAPALPVGDREITLRPCGPGCKHRLKYEAREVNLADLDAFVAVLFVARDWAAKAGTPEQDQAPAPDVKRLLSVALGELFDDEAFVDGHFSVPAYKRVMDGFFAANELPGVIVPWMPAIRRAAADFPLVVRMMTHLRASARPAQDAEPAAASAGQEG